MQKQKFLTVVSNLETGGPLWFGRERKKVTRWVHLNTNKKPPICESGEIPACRS